MDNQKCLKASDGHCCLYSRYVDLRTPNCNASKFNRIRRSLAPVLDGLITCHPKTFQVFVILSYFRRRRFVRILFSEINSIQISCQRDAQIDKRNWNDRVLFETALLLGVNTDANAMMETVMIRFMRDWEFYNNRQEISAGGS